MTNPNYSNPFYNDELPSIGEWNGAFNSLQTALGFSPLNIAGGTMTGELITNASGINMAGFNLPAGLPPTLPNNGDMWSTTTGLFIDLGGTVQQLAGGTTGPSNYAYLTANNTFQGSYTFTGTMTVTGNSFYPNYTPPRGRLTVVQGTPVVLPSSGTIGAQILYYAPYNGNLVPISPNGISFLTYQFTSSAIDTTGLSLNLGSSSTWPANSIFDVFAIVNNFAPALVTGPAWTNSTTRSALLGQIQGTLINASSMVCQLNSGTTVTKGAGQATYLGTIATNKGTAGQITFNYGSSAGGTGAILNVWNYYNRIDLSAAVGDSAIYTYISPPTIRPSNNNLQNSINFVQGIPEDYIYINYTQNIQAVFGTIGIGIGLDSISSYTGFIEVSGTGLVPQIQGTLSYQISPQTGLHFIQALESAVPSGLSNVLMNQNELNGQQHYLYFHLMM